MIQLGGRTEVILLVGRAEVIQLGGRAEVIQLVGRAEVIQLGGQQEVIQLLGRAGETVGDSGIVEWVRRRKTVGTRETVETVRTD